MISKGLTFNSFIANFIKLLNFDSRNYPNSIRSTLNLLIVITFLFMENEI